MLRWVAYYRVEPFGEDWLQTAKSTAFVLAALGVKLDSDFIQRFMPGYDPNREMTEDEIAAQIAAFTNRP